MTNSATITYTKKQAQNLVEYYNQFAKHKLNADQAHLLFHDNSDNEMEEMGKTYVEIPARDAISGNPHTYEIDQNEINLVWNEV